MDDGIGRILDAIDKKGLRERTLVVFVSDNGGQRSWSSKSQYGGDYAELPHTVLGDNRPLRGWKGDVYEGGMRVPAVVRWPGVLKPARVESPIHIVDWMPTLCALAGWTPKDDPSWDGRDVWDVVRGQSKGSSRTLYWKTPQARALRHGGWKLVVPNGNRQPELYELAKDPYETRDLASSKAETLAELRELLREVSSKDRGRRGDE
jgi:arylsulfatase A-like enzyme